jgi:lincosamide nucleotidyltransferase
MERRQHLLDRLDQISQSIEKTNRALALIGQGSAGPELDRLDGYSDLDFLVVVKSGHKSRFLKDLYWLASICPIAYSFKVSDDGYKLLFEDGIFCEFGVFEEAELITATFGEGTWAAEGRIIWKDKEFDDDLCPKKKTDTPQKKSVEWMVGEALTNLFVGLGRYRRGEKLSAARFIQGYAVDRIVELSELIEAERPGHKDSYSVERRYEQHFPRTSANLPQFMQGYAHSVESARAILEFLERHFDVNAAIRNEILGLCETPSH